jgi:hypothetical protein
MDRFRQGHAEKEENDEALHTIAKIQTVQRTLKALLSDLLTILEVRMAERVGESDVLDGFTVSLCHIASRFRGYPKRKELRSLRTDGRLVSDGWD